MDTQKLLFDLVEYLYNGKNLSNKKTKLETLYPTKISPILINTLQKKSKLPKKKDSEKLSGNLISPIFPKQISNLVSFSQSNVILNFI